MTNNSCLQVPVTGGQEQAENGSLIHIINDKMARLSIPAIVYISLVMVLGLIGNSFVCYYYTFKEKKSTNTFFIVVLSVFDLLTCFIIMPSEIAIISLYYTFLDNFACKTLRFISFSLAIASILTLVAIAINRYKRICHVARPQMNITQARRISVIIVLLSILLALPSLFIYGVYRAPIVNNLNLDVHGHTCTFTKKAAHRVYVSTYTGAQFFIVVVLLAAMVVLYSIIGRTIYHHRKHIRRQFTKSYNERERNMYSETEKGQIKKEIMKNSALLDELVGSDNIEKYEPYKPSIGNAKPISNNLSEIIDDTNKDFLKIVQCKAEPNIVKDLQKEYQFDADTVRVTLVMVIVTVIFIVSFLPYLTLAAWGALKGRHKVQFLSEAGLVAHHIGLRSYLLNSSLNPWIYGIFNSQFRQFYFGWCLRKMG